MKNLSYMKKELTKIYGKEKTNEIISLVKKHYQASLLLCKDASSGELFHLENTILPTSSFYKALLEVDNDNAFENTNKIIIGRCKKGAKVLNAMLKLPGMKSVFMKILPKMALKIFGRECGFDYKNFQSNKINFQMDMTMCPYVKYAKILKVEKLTSIFCESDFTTYGNLSGIVFERTQTLGTGGNLCDFKFSRLEK